jgi:hypothetical protein
MTRALYIGGNNPHRVLSLAPSFAETTVLVGTFEREEHWRRVVPKNVKLITAYAPLICSGPPTGLIGEFDYVETQSTDEAVRACAGKFAKPGGKVVLL